MNNLWEILTFKAPNSMIYDAHPEREPGDGFILKIFNPPTKSPTFTSLSYVEHTKKGYHVFKSRR